MFAAVICATIFLAVLHGGESQVAWTTPSGGNGALSTSVDEQDVTTATAITGLTVTATATSPQLIDNYLITQNSFSIFSIATTTAVGHLSIDANKGLDYEFMSAHILVIEADDDTSPTAVTGTATVTINVVNLSTDPTWSMLRYCVIIADQAAAGTTLTTLTASDSSGTIGYAVSPTTDFEVSSSGVIKSKTGVVMNRGTADSYALTLTANDGTLTSTARVVVCVGSSTQCSSCGSVSSGAAAIAFNIITFLSALLLLFIK